VFFKWINVCLESRYTNYIAKFEWTFWMNGAKLVLVASPWCVDLYKIIFLVDCEELTRLLGPIKETKSTKFIYLFLNYWKLRKTLHFPLSQGRREGRRGGNFYRGPDRKRGSERVKFTSFWVIFQNLTGAPYKIHHSLYGPALSQILSKSWLLYSILIWCTEEILEFHPSPIFTQYF
jgi:hypothetical protein